MFQIGEKIFYPVHGAGIIEAIETKEILGEEHKYYVMKISSVDMRVLVPVEKAEQVGVRIICDVGKLEEVRHVLTTPFSNWDENWNRRYRIHMDKIKSGDICELAEVVRNLTLRDGKKGLSAGEKKMLDNSRKILLSEIILAADVSLEHATEELDSLLVKAGKHLEQDAD